MSETNTRRYPRYEVDALVDISSPDEVLLYHRIQNISLGGICILSPTIEELGTIVDIVINTPDGKSLSLEGEVVWANRHEPMDMGIRYRNLDDEKREALRRLIASTATRQLAPAAK